MTRTPSPHAIDDRWREPLTDEQKVDLVPSHGGNPTLGWWPRIREHSLGRVGARDHQGLLVGS